MAAKIHEFKETISAQNQMIITLRAERQSTRDTLTNLVTSLVKYKPTFTTQATMVETGAYPDIKSEDMMTKDPSDNLRAIAAVFKTIVSSLEENRQELRAIYKELDAEVEDVMNQWQQIKAQDDRDAKLRLFREDTVAKASVPRAPTPETPVVAGASTNGISSSRSTPLDTTNTSKRGQEGSGKKASGSKTLESVLSPTKGKASAGSTTGQLKK